MNAKKGRRGRPRRRRPVVVVPRTPVTIGPRPVTVVPSKPVTVGPRPPAAVPPTPPTGGPPTAGGLPTPPTTPPPRTPTPRPPSRLGFQWGLIVGALLLGLFLGFWAGREVTPTQPSQPGKTHVQPAPAQPAPVQPAPTYPEDEAEKILNPE